MFYETERNDHGLPHDPFKAIVAPRPIGWISTRSNDGTPNLAPYSFFNAISDDPKLVMFSSSGLKDSAEFSIESGEFVVNLATYELRDAMNRSSAAVSRETNEFILAGLTEAPCRLLKAPRVEEAAAALECKVTQSFRPSTLAGHPASAVVVIGQVVGIHINERILRDGMVAMDLAQPLTRLGYHDYGVTREVFQMVRPKGKGDKPAPTS